MTLTQSPECSFEIDPEKLTAALEGQLITAPGSGGTRTEARRVAMQMVYGVRQGLGPEGPKLGLEELKEEIDQLKDLAKDLSGATASTMASVIRVVQDQINVVQNAAEHI